MDEEIEILSHAKRRGTESDMEDENEQEIEKPVHPTETKDDPPAQGEQNQEDDVTKSIEVTVEEKTGEVDEDAHKNSTSSSHDTNQVGLNQGYLLKETILKRMQVTEMEVTESKQHEAKEPSATSMCTCTFFIKC